MRLKTLELSKNYGRQGTLSGYRIRHVCRACNSGWMGGYEEAVKPFLAEMIMGNRVDLDEGMQRLLTEYITLKLIVLDAGLDNRFLPESVANEFYAHRTLPADMTMYILNCVEGEWRQSILCLGAAFGGESDHPLRPPNVKSFAVGFGNLFTYTVVRSDGEFEFDFEPGLAVPLWPKFSGLIRWPTLIPIKSDRAEFIAHTITRTHEQLITAQNGAN